MLPLMCPTRTSLARPRAHQIAVAALLAIILGSGLSVPTVVWASDGPVPAKAMAKDAAGKPKPNSRATAKDRQQADRLDPLARAGFWAQQYSLDETDLEAGTRLAAALRGLGQYDEAVETAKQVLVSDPKAYEALLECARAYTAAGQGFYAIEPALKAANLKPRDWRPLSLLGAAYEQVGRDADAIGSYVQALKRSRDNPAVLSNLALYYAGRGDYGRAEGLLRKAVSQPGATVQIRQNLSLVLGYQGKIGEAEKILRETLPPAMADNNLAYLKAASSLTPRP
ncbi:MAG: hypothetical protein RJA87_103 [Pseudomonadota bacterium]